MLRVLYAAGLRVSELCGLTWADVQERATAGLVTVFGKGGKTRAVLLSDGLWCDLIGTKPSDAKGDTPVFVSRKHCHLTPSAVWRIVRTAAERADIETTSRYAHARPSDSSARYLAV